MNEISLNMENGFIDLNKDNNLLTVEQINIIKNDIDINLPNTIQSELNNKSIIKKMVYIFSCLGCFTIALIIVMTTI